MSIVVAVKKDNKIAIAADEFVTVHGQIVDRKNYKPSKIVNIADSYIGIVGDILYINILKLYCRHLLDKHRNSRVVSNLLRDELLIYETFLGLYKWMKKECGFIQERHEDTNSPFFDLDSHFLIANSSGIFEVDNCGRVTKYNDYFALGAGAYFSMGALTVLYDDSVFDAYELARKSTLAAIKNNSYCNGKVNLIEVV